MGAILASIAKKIALSLLTQKLAEEVIVILLKEAAERTDNKVDDRLIAAVEKALS